VPVRKMGGGCGGADGQLNWPLGLRFTLDGSGVVVADSRNDRVSLFSVADGCFAKQLATGVGGPYDVERCGSGWLVACQLLHAVKFVHDDAGTPIVALGRYGTKDREFCYPSALTLVPDWGLVVRERGASGRVQVFATRDMIAMDTMSRARLAWIGVVARVLSQVKYRKCDAVRGGAERSEGEVSEHPKPHGPEVLGMSWAPQHRVHAWGCWGDSLSGPGSPGDVLPRNR